MEIIRIHRDYQRDLLLVGLKRFFGDFEDRLLEQVMPLIEWIGVSSGEVIFEEGAPGDDLFFVVSGRLRATVKSGNRDERLLGEIMRGETIGEMSVVTGEPRTATITAVRSSVLVRLTRRRFEHLLSEFPLIAIRLTRLIIERLRRSNIAQPIGKRPVNIALVPISPDLDLPSISAALAERMRLWGRTLLLSSRLILERFGADTLNATRESPDSYLSLTRWLDEVETQHDFILFVSSQEDSAWTRRCLQHADEVLLLANAELPEEVYPFAHTLLGKPGGISNATRRLVLFQPETKPLPTNTAAWLDRLNVTGHIHLRDGVSRDLDRLARILSGNTTGLVLSGGGARGFAHLGIYRALNEAGIDLDYVGGTSIGAAVGSLIALDIPPDDAVELIRRIFKFRPVGDFNLMPFVSLIAGKRLESQLENAYRHLNGRQPDIEDCWKNFYCIASSYSHAREVVIRRGSMARLVRASLSIPAFLPPVYHHGDALIDGGIFNNFPTDEMARIGVGCMIGVDLRDENFGPVDGDGIPNTWQIVSRYLKANKEGRSKIPFIGGMLYRAPTLYSKSHQAQSIAPVDILIRPDLRSIGILQWKALDRAVEIGYSSAKAELERMSKKC